MHCAFTLLYSDLQHYRYAFSKIIYSALAFDMDYLFSVKYCIVLWYSTLPVHFQWNTILYSDVDCALFIFSKTLHCTLAFDMDCALFIFTKTLHCTLLFNIQGIFSLKYHIVLWHLTWPVHFQQKTILYSGIWHELSIFTKTLHCTLALDMHSQFSVKHCILLEHSTLPIHF